MEERWLEVVHGCNALDDIGEDVQNLRLGQPMLEPGVHEVNQTAA